MAGNKVSVDAVKLAHNIVVEVEIRRVKEMMWRLWLARRLLHLACWIGNLSLKENEVIGVLITEKPEIPNAQSHRVV